MEKCGLDSRFIFADEYHDLNLTQKLSAGDTGYKSVNYVLPKRDVISTLYNLVMDATVDHIHVY